MPKRLALLTWEHIQTINKLCSSTIKLTNREWREFEVARQGLVTGFLLYLREWRPCGPVDDSFRLALIEAITEFQTQCRSLPDEIKPSFSSHLSLEAAIAECANVIELLRTAMMGDEVPDAVSLA